MDFHKLVIRHRARLWLLLGVFWLFLLTLVSLLPTPDTAIEVNDKLSHFIAWLLLTSWFSLLIKQRGNLLLLVLGLLAYGAFIEVLQSLTSYRFAEWADLVANLAGIAVATPLYLMPLHRKIREFLNGQVF